MTNQNDKLLDTYFTELEQTINQTKDQCLKNDLHKSLIGGAHMVNFLKQNLDLHFNLNIELHTQGKVYEISV